ncbi:hypothetical protein J057_12611 [Marinobacter nanhaiticus D15-8W]|uniref:Uncharacterized protein n=1 Tax=Marinobacter nanhaiticus D15-8W TaxID=626887 RepID=N6WYM3_9GAMM|nr:hypothetical protein J057_12611 [Marinobacter nanhaiticus D15-8W]
MIFSAANSLMFADLISLVTLVRRGPFLTLQKKLGQSDIKLTMRYAHLSTGRFADGVEAPIINV